jgi:hypothetical protein
MGSNFAVFFEMLEALENDLKTLQVEYERSLTVLQKENDELRGKISEIQAIAGLPSTGEHLASTQKGSIMPDANQDELAGFPRFSEFYKLPIEYHPNFEKGIRNMESTQKESLKQALRRLAKRGYQSTRAQQDHKKFEVGSKDLPVPAGATASKSGRTVRYFWGIGDHKALHVYYVGKRGDVYRSER